MDSHFLLPHIVMHAFPHLLPIMKLHDRFHLICSNNHDLASIYRCIDGLDACSKLDVAVMGSSGVLLDELHWLRLLLLQCFVSA